MKDRLFTLFLVKLTIIERPGNYSAIRQYGLYHSIQIRGHGSFIYN
ncbi:hypothetical protein JN06_01453 [Bacteroides zoogleoformans]|nr:hypothetical protein JN06_01453 [Bacteroides zoogleoformans]